MISSNTPEQVLNLLLFNFLCTSFAASALDADEAAGLACMHASVRTVPASRLSAGVSFLDA